MSSPQVGDVLTTIEQLDACPTGTIVRSSRQGVAVAEDGGQLRPWALVGDSFPRESEVLLSDPEWTVIWLPPVTRVEITTDAWIIDDGEVTFLHVTSELHGLLWSVPVGARVRVTVEKIGNDNE